MYLGQEADELEDQIYLLKGEIAEKQKRLDAIRSACNHNWGDIVYDPEVRPAGHFKGDPPGTMGIDRQLPFDYPEQRKDRWKRTCVKCGLTQTTDRKENKVTSVPVF